MFNHQSGHVRRRAIIAFRSLSRLDRDLLKWVSAKIEKRLHDAEMTVVAAALIISVDIVNMGTSLIYLADLLVVFQVDTTYRDAIRDTVTGFLVAARPNVQDKAKQSFLVPLIRTLRVLG